jgi:proteic killer suppression protein
VIRSFADDATAAIWRGETARRPAPDIQRQALKRLAYLHLARRLEDLFQPPSNRFHALAGFNPPRYSLWVNHQWRITFEWNSTDAVNVRLEDYH